MKRPSALGISLLLASGCVLLLVSAATAAITVVVEDAWNDGERNYPASTGDPSPAADNYSENGFDWDDDLDTESAWFIGGSNGTLDPVGAGGPLRLFQNSTSSSSVTTYFTPEGQECELAQEGDWMELTWQFEVSGFVTTNTSQGLRMAIVDSPALSRVTNDNSPGSAAYTGYGMFLNMDTILNRSDPFELMKRADGSGDLLSASAEWTALADDGTDEAEGYLEGNLYTYTMKITRLAAGALEIYTSMAGGNIDDDGLIEITYNDATPGFGGYKFDTFEFRPDGNDRAWDVIDTTLFKVVHSSVVPEPACLALLLSGLATLFLARRGRKP